MTTWYPGGDHYQTTHGNHGNAGSWSITDYLRAGIDKIDVNSINQTLNSWTEKIGTTLFSSVLGTTLFSSVFSRTLFSSVFAD